MEIATFSDETAASEDPRRLDSCEARSVQADGLQRGVSAFTVS